MVAMFVYWAHAWTPNKQLARYRRPPSTPGFFWQRPLLKLFSKSSSFLEEEKKAATTIINDTPLHHHGLLSPYHILNPVSFTELPSLAERSLPLEACIRLLRRTLQAIINSHPLQLNQIQSKVIRIEHTISHAVDPLCWLQAQTQQDNGHPSLYFASAEGTLETAVYGSSWLESRPAKDNKDYWKLVENLPPDCYVYGAERFDSKSNISDEWKNFGQAFWVLPAVEIRKKDNKTIIAIHLLNDEDHSFTQSARRVLEIMAYVSDKAVPSIPPTTLPPVLFRASTYGPGLDGQEIYERGVTEALEKFQSSTLKKVVLARRMDLTFDRHASRNVHALDILRKWKFATQPGGHMFYINPGGSGGEFFGCTPERLFQVHSNEILSEAVAGTRPRGSNQQADEELARQLFLSPKDKDENVITGNFILSVFRDMEERGYVDLSKGNNTTLGNHFSVRRLRHLQHICQRFQCTLSASAGGQRDAGATDAIQYLLTSLHPTPAVGGFPKKEAMDFIRNHETTGFDRGFYSGPVGFVGKDSAEIVVGIRSGLVTRHEQKSKVSVYAGAGIVPLSSVQAEFVETSYKLAVVSSVFPQSPITLQSAQNSNAAWATAFIEELIRNGVTQFYICPGSRSTPLVAAIAKAVRSNVGVVHAMSIHDERGAGFRALGYGRGRGRPAAVVTSSGTATSNLYPSVVEAGMDGVPLLVLTADRPYESRDTGANQAIDQVKLFSSTYIRWFRDVLPPNDNVPVSVALADAAHGVSMSRELRGAYILKLRKIFVELRAHTIIIIIQVLCI